MCDVTCAQATIVTALVKPPIHDSDTARRACWTNEWAGTASMARAG
jgi:hypothetical protein